MTGPVHEEVLAETAEVVAGEAVSIPPVEKGYELALLHFFRDLIESERLKILVELDAIPGDFDERMTQGVERMLFDSLVNDGHLSDLVSKVKGVLMERGMDL
jgi:hypothetical protein